MCHMTPSNSVASLQQIWQSGWLCYYWSKITWNVLLWKENSSASGELDFFLLQSWQSSVFVISSILGNSGDQGWLCDFLLMTQSWFLLVWLSFFCFWVRSMLSCVAGGFNLLYGMFSSVLDIKIGVAICVSQFCLQPTSCSFSSCSCISFFLFLLEDLQTP
jgi:hypothetical protein